MATRFHLWLQGLWEQKTSLSPWDWPVQTPLHDLASPVRPHLGISGPHLSAHLRLFLEHWQLPWKQLLRQNCPRGLRKNSSRKWGHCQIPQLSEGAPIPWSLQRLLLLSGPGTSRRILTKLTGPLACLLPPVSPPLAQPPHQPS